MEADGLRDGYIVSGSLLRAFCKCPRLPYMNRFADPREAVDVLQPTMPDIEDNNIEENDISPNKESVTDSPDKKEAQTRDAMGQGEESIYWGLLRKGNYWGCIPRLVKVARRSRLGRHSYDVDIASWTSTKDSRKRIAWTISALFYASIVESVQGAASCVRVGYYPMKDILYRPDPCEYNSRLSDVLTQLDVVLGMKTDPAPMLTSSCGKTCRWRVRCEKDARASGSLSLVVPRATIPALNQLGVHNLADLAAVTEVDKVVVPYLPKKTAILAIERARVHKGLNPPRVIGSPSLPPRSDLEVFIDFEGLLKENEWELWDESRFTRTIFMYGVLTRQGKRVRYRAFIAKRDNIKSFRLIERQFIEHLRQYPKTTFIFHYGGYEPSYIKKRFGVKYGLLRRMVDVHPLVRGHAAIPAFGFSLKDIAKELGFQWRGGDLTGLQAECFWRKGKSKTLCQYNEDDLRALMLVNDWLREK